MRGLGTRIGGRTPLMARLTRALAVSAAAERPDSPPVDELLERRSGLSRRRLLQSMAGVAGLALVPRVLRGQPASAPDVVIVGAGIAGLNAAYRLSDAGFPVRIFEAARRTGGRIYSRSGVIVPDIVTELGAELVNTDHRDMLALARAFDIPLIDLHVASTGPALQDVMFAGGQRRTEAQLVAALRPMMRRVLADRARVERDPAARQRIDRMSLAQYLASMGVDGWLRSFLTVAFTSEMGSDVGAQSALYFLSVITTTPVLDLYQSDEHYGLEGGNQRVPDALAARLAGKIELEHRLESLRASGSGFTLTFAGPNHAARDVRADVVILTMPFTTLRQVELRVDLPSLKRRAIRELGYGTNAKLFAGLKERVWQGAMNTDLPFNQAWDNARNRTGTAGGMSFFAGGAAGIAMGAASAADQVARYFPDAVRVVPALAGQLSGTAARFHWPSFDLALGSYACYRPGQWTAFEEAMAPPVGGLYFAGEHCSPNFQGFMNGGAESGRIAADAVIARVSGLRLAR